MAKPRLSVERESAEDAVIIDGSTRADNPLMPLDDIDSEGAWDEWIDSLKSAEATGTVRVYKVPRDTDGNPMIAKGSRHILLMSCAHQEYAFDELVAKIKIGFLEPGELATIRLAGTRSGARGVMFNRYVSVQRDKTATGGVSVTESGGGQVLGVIQAMQNQTRQQGEMLERIMAGRGLVPPTKPTSETVKEWMAILGPILSPVILAWMQRPAPKSDLEGIIGAMVKLKDLTGDGGSHADDENTTLGIVKAVAGPGLQLLNTLAQNKGPTAVPRRVRVVPPGIPQAAPISIPPPTRTAANPSPATTPVADPSIQPDLSSSPRSASSTTSGPPPTTSENPAMLAQLAPQLEQLATLAEQGADPVEVSKLVFDMLPQNDDIDQQLYGIVSDAASFNRLALLAPKMRAHADWFEKLRLAMLAEFAEDEKEQA